MRPHHRQPRSARGGGAKADGPQRSKRRATGTGWVRETRDHDYVNDYADAQRRGHPVTLPWTLLVTETTARDHGRALPHLRPARRRVASAQ
jgi:hypothetical protein